VISWGDIAKILEKAKRTGKQHAVENSVLKLRAVYIKSDYENNAGLR
jgi:hypothetical protein